MRCYCTTHRRGSIGGTPCNANPGFSEMPSLACDGHALHASLMMMMRGGGATKTEGGGVRPQTGVSSSGSTTRTNGNALTFPEIMGGSWTVMRSSLAVNQKHREIQIYG